MKNLFLLLYLTVIGSCASNSTLKEDTAFSKPFLESNLIKGKTSKERVVEILGGPEMINSSSEGGEQWVYSKHQFVDETNGVGVGALGVDLLSYSLIGVGVSADHSTSTSFKRTTTLTIYFTRKGILASYQLSKSKG